MPLYDFKCSDGHVFERFVSLSNFEDHQSCDCGAAASRMLAAPSVICDTIDPVRSMANGKMYDSLSGLYASYRADGNPQGVNYECVGDDTSSMETFEPPKRDDKRAHEAIERVLQENGI